MTKLDLAGRLGHRLKKFGMNVLGDQNAIHGNANLAHIREGASSCSHRGLLDIGIGQHDEGALSAEFERNTLHVLRGGSHDRAPGRHRSGGRDHTNAGMCRQDSTDVRTSAWNIVEHAGWQPGISQAFHDHAGGKWRLVRRLHHHRAACRERRADFPAVDIDRIVPWNDRTNHADRSALHKAAHMSLRTRP